MAWRPDPVTSWMNQMRFLVRSTWVMSALIVGLFVLYLTGRVAWQVMELLERTIFAHPW